ncbi:MAG TPA: hypothetical protein VHM64_00185, partial [Candidatus Binatia bacterium]|nr:hypothetical protein [Candidatus Binatia bacterium]
MSDNPTPQSNSTSSLQPQTLATRDAEASKPATVTPVAKRSWRIFEGLARLRVFNALRHREYRLIWYGQIFASMATWM